MNESPFHVLSVDLATTEAIKFGHEYVGTEHQLLACLKLANGHLSKLLREKKLTYRRVKREVIVLVCRGPRRRSAVELLFTDRANNVFDRAISLAAYRNELLEAPHLFFSLLSESDSIAKQVLGNLGFDGEEISGIDELLL